MKATLSTGETLGFPVASRELNQLLVGYLARSADVRRLLPRDLRPLDFGYGLTLVYIYWLEAAASDFGPYNEMAVTLPVREPFFGAEARYYYANPITTERARQVAYELWGHPSTLGEVSIAHGATDITGSLTIDSEFVLSLRASPPPAGPGEEQGLLSTGADYAKRGLSEVYRYAQTAQSCSREERPRHVELTLGHHELSDVLRSLIIDSTPVNSIYFTGCTIWSGPRFSDIYQVKH
jgi:hypothetical protein